MMENEVIYNPSGMEKDYLGNLNIAFSNWGDSTNYAWVFNRKVGDFKTDQLIIKREGEAIAGSAITYRKVSLNATENLNVGIMTGSWTLPAARNTGCFSTIIEESKKMCLANGVQLLTAYVTEENPSSRRLEAAGSLMIHSWNLFAPHIITDTKNDIVLLDATLEQVQTDIYEQYTKSLKGTVHFSYTKKEFVSQFIHRPEETIVCKVGGEFVILSSGFNAMKVLLATYQDLEHLEGLLTGINNWCISKYKKAIFLYTTNRGMAQHLSSLDYETKKGFYTVIDCNATSNRRLIENITISMGDKM